MKIDHLTLGDLAAIFKKRLLPLLLALLLCGTVGFLVRVLVPTRYQAEASFQVRSMQSEEYLNAYGLTSSQLAVLQTLAKQYADTVPAADALLDRMIANHGLVCTREELRAMLSTKTDGVTFTVLLTHREGAVAVAAAKALAVELPGFLQESFWPAVSVSRMCVTSLHTSTAATRASMSPFLLAGICAVGGFLLAYLWFLLCFLFRNRLADGDEIVRVLPEDALLATIPHVLPPADAGEAFFALRERLPRGKAGQALSVALLTALPAEGASFVALGLAVSLQATGASVLFLDADLRNGDKKYFPLRDAEPGLAEFLGGRERKASALIHRCDRYAFDVLPAGVLPISPAEASLTAKMEELLAALAPKYDYIIADFPAYRTAPDGLLAARAFDTTLLVAAPHRAGARELRAVRAALGEAECAVCGLVVNHPPRSKHQPV
ncbi:MAG: CpsD/CapB family tyrosine-protein kinase [Clostridia bacterium]|nr:CpsD/CapB family tyrosine-protein kinase [Clostridia bacterium]